MARVNTSKNSIGYKELKAEIRQGQCRSLYVLYGEETFLIDKLIESLTDLLIEPGSRALDRVVFDAGGQSSKLDPERLSTEISTPPFLSRRKLIIVKHCGWLSASSGRSGNTFSDLDENPASTNNETADDSEEQSDSSAVSTQKNRQEKFMRLLDRLSDSVCLVMVENKVDRRLKQLISQIEQKGVLAEIGLEQPRTLQVWLEAECRSRNLTIDHLAAESMIDRCDQSMQIIWQEMTKLFLYCAYTSCKHIDLPLVAELSLPDLRGNIFDLTDALSAGRTERALILVDTLIGQKQPVQLIQFMLARHLRQLICAAEIGRPDQIASHLKVMPFVANRLANQARHLSLNTLEELYSRCFDTDMLVKTGQISDRLALETLLVTAAELIKKSVHS